MRRSHKKLPVQHCFLECAFKNAELCLRPFKVGKEPLGNPKCTVLVSLEFGKT